MGNPVNAAYSSVGKSLHPLAATNIRGFTNSHNIKRFAPFEILGITLAPYNLCTLFHDLYCTFLVPVLRKEIRNHASAFNIRPILS